MANQQDTDNAKNNCLACVQDQINAANATADAGTDADSARMIPVLDGLRQKRTDIMAQQYIGSLHSDAMENALSAIVSATTDMKSVAQHMKDVTTFVSNLAAFLGAGSKVLSA